MTDDTTKPRKRNYNWLALYSILPRNPKVLALRSDSQRFAFIVALCAARDEYVRGQWPDRRYLIAALGKYGKHVPALLEVELVVEDPDGTVRIPFWDQWQPDDPTNAKRQAEYRQRQKDRNALRNGDTVTSNDEGRGGEVGEVQEVQRGTGDDTIGACIKCFQPIRLSEPRRSGRLGDVHEACPR